MEDRVPGNSSATSVSTKSSAAKPCYEGRSVWVLTAYGISGLALFGVLAYYFVEYVTR